MSEREKEAVSCLTEALDILLGLETMPDLQLTAEEREKFSEHVTELYALRHKAAFRYRQIPREEEPCI